MTKDEFKGLGVAINTLADIDIAMRNLEDCEFIPAHLAPQVKSLTNKVIALQSDLTRWVYREEETP